MSAIHRGRYISSYDDPIVPSQTTAVWLQFHNVQTSDRLYDDAGRPLAGKWLLYQTSEMLDSLWPRLKDATNANTLGVSMKASTAGNPGRYAEGLVRIYTRDWRDFDDIRRVLVALRELGVLERLYYKPDAQTLQHFDGTLYCSPRGSVLNLTPADRQWCRSNGLPLTSCLTSSAGGKGKVDALSIDTWL